jgi:GTPase SAR1 family protein
MSANTLIRPALGEQVELGTLYDARLDKFLSHSIINEPLLETVVTSHDINTTEVVVGENDTLKERFNKMAIPTDLQTSIVTGIASVKGAARYLKHKKQASFPIVHRALYQTITTKLEKLNFASESTRELLDFGGLETGNATHLVSEVSYGVRNIIAAQHLLSSNDDSAQIEDDIKEALEELEANIGAGPGLPPRYREQADEPSNHIEVALFSDMEDIVDESPKDMEAAQKFLATAQNRCAGINDGRGVPLTYTLIPISFFSLFFGATLPPTPVIPQLSSECQDQFIDLLDDLQQAQQQLNAYYHALKSNRGIIHRDHLVDVGDELHDAREAIVELTSNYHKLIKRARTGRADAREISQLISDFETGPHSAKKLLGSTEAYANKLKFLPSIMKAGARYVGYTGQPLNEVLRRNSSGTTYVLFFNNDTMRDEKTWETNVEYLRGVCQQQLPGCLAVIIDCDATNEPLEVSHIAKFEGTQLITQNVLEQQKQLADKNLIRYNDQYLDASDLSAPSQRRPITIPCAGPNCNGYQAREWICCKCHAPVEYGVVDRFVYCDCGRAPYETCEFRCSDASHGSSWVSYKKPALHRMLANLPPAPEINLLILGETGVGKSTFINAFVNYLTFSSLDEGLGAERLNWIIPCSFSMQTEDPSSGRLVQHKISVGADEDEVDGSKGSSATQKATVYPIYFGGRLIRLIDTPGIGDTRGADQDKKNMINVVSVLRNYPELHGILILLKPNNSRLTVMFRFCIKELLTHLHRDAARNMVFGFTNTRGSNYRPGDTFSPLEALLHEYRDVIPGLYRDTVYCFDSESFRYLAANKKGHDMGMVDDYRRSWDHSGGEAHRLLDYVQNLVPHQVRSTVSLNETRYLIEQLTAPMQKISSAIIDTIAKNRQQAEDLKNTRATGSSLQKKLQIIKTTPHCEELSRPLTVCSNDACVDIRGKDASGKEIKLRKVICHNPCCLTDVPPYIVGTPQLKSCAAFAGGRDKCSQCGHHWQEHEHTRVRWSERQETTTDPDVAAALDGNRTDIQVKETQIQALYKRVSELELEHRQIQQAAAQFSHYLSNNSITHYNDATLEYMDHLIKEERQKVGFGGNQNRLEQLQKDRAQYKAFVDAMESGLPAEGRDGFSGQALDVKGVYRLVEELYRMPHFGSDLKRVAHIVGTAYAASFRERPYRVRGRYYWSRSAPLDARRTASIPTKLHKTNPYAESSMRSYSQSFRQGRASSSSGMSQMPLSNPFLGEAFTDLAPMQQPPVRSMLDIYTQSSFPEASGSQGKYTYSDEKKAPMLSDSSTTYEPPPIYGTQEAPVFQPKQAKRASKFDFLKKLTKGRKPWDDDKDRVQKW